MFSHSCRTHTCESVHDHGITATTNAEKGLLDEIVDAALSNDSLQTLCNSGLSVLDVLAGSVPGSTRSRSSSRCGSACSKRTGVAAAWLCRLICSQRARKPGRAGACYTNEMAFRFNNRQSQ